MYRNCLLRIVFIEAIFLFASNFFFFLTFALALFNEQKIRMVVQLQSKWRNTQTKSISFTIRFAETGNKKPKDVQNGAWSMNHLFYCFFFLRSFDIFGLVLNSWFGTMRIVHLPKIFLEFLIFIFNLIYFSFLRTAYIRPKKKERNRNSNSNQADISNTLNGQTH